MGSLVSLVTEIKIYMIDEGMFDIFFKLHILENERQYFLTIFLLARPSEHRKIRDFTSCFVTNGCIVTSMLISGKVRPY